VYNFIRKYTESLSSFAFSCIAISPIPPPLVQASVFVDPHFGRHTIQYFEYNQADDARKTRLEGHDQRNNDERRGQSRRLPEPDRGPCPRGPLHARGRELGHRGIIPTDPQKPHDSPDPEAKGMVSGADMVRQAAAELFFAGPESHSEGHVFGAEGHGEGRDDEEEWRPQVVGPSNPQQRYVLISDISRLTSVVVGLTCRLQIDLLR